MASEKEKARTAWKTSTTTTGTPRRKIGTAKEATARVEAKAKQVTPERKQAALEKMQAKKQGTPIKTKPKTNTVAAPKKQTSTTTTPKVERELATLLKQQGDMSITSSVRDPDKGTLGMGGLGGRFDPTMAEATALDQPQIQEPVAQAGGEQVAPLPPAQELPPDAPLWLKLIRGVLTPVPPLAMIPHMFIEGMEQKRAAAQAEDAKNMEYFWDVYDNNPMAAAELAKTPLFRDTLQRKHGFTAQDLQDIGEASKAQPFKSSELAQMIGQGVQERRPEQTGITQGDRRFGQPQEPIKLPAGTSLYDPEKHQMLYNAAEEDRKTFHEINKKTNKDATELESMLLQKSVSGNQAKVKWMVAGDKLVAYDATMPYKQMMEDKAYSIFNNKNKGKSEVYVAKDGLGATIGWEIIDVENGTPVLGPDGKPTGEMNYPSEFIDLDEVLYNNLAQKFDGQEPPSPKEARNWVQETYDKVLKNLKREMGGDIKGDEELSSMIMQDVLERYLQARGGNPPVGHGQATTTNTVSPEVQQYQ